MIIESNMDAAIDSQGIEKKQTLLAKPTRGLKEEWKTEHL